MASGKKIFILNIDKPFMPNACAITYPRYNNDFGVEQDFYNYMVNSNMVTSNPDEAHWHYLPLYWTRSYYNALNGFDGPVNISLHLENLQKSVGDVVLDFKKTFTICQMEDGPLIDIGEMVVFAPSKRDKSFIDIPFIRSPMKKSFFLFGKTYKASFVGRSYLSDERKGLIEKLNGVDGFYIKDMKPQSKMDKKLYSKVMAQSSAVLCPRGYGSNSFRFFESMELGSVPFLISDVDSRPFKDFLDWQSCSFFSDSVDETIEMLNSYGKETLLEMGKKAQNLWKESLSQGKWCRFVISELNNLDN